MEVYKKDAMKTLAKNGGRLKILTKKKARYLIPNIMKITTRQKVLIRETYKWN